MWKKSNKGENKVDNLFRVNQIQGEKETKSSGLKDKKEQTIKSLQEVENFLRQAKKAFNHIKLYKILK